MNPRSDRYAMLDGWRGVAAIAVVFHHVSHLPIGGPAVMCFFVISGYCIAACSEHALRNGYSFLGFMKRRMVRIYPPYLFSVGFYLLTRIVKLWSGGANDLDRPFYEFLQTATLTQWITLAFAPEASPAANPSLLVASHWSLCYEEQFYLVLGLPLLLVLASQRVRSVVTIFHLVVALFVASLIFNFFKQNLAYGVFIEYFAMFGIGCLVFYRLCRFSVYRARWAIDLLLVLLAGAGLYLLNDTGNDWETSRWDDLMVAAVFGLLLIALHKYDSWFCRAAVGRLLASLGLISYSLYLIHQFNLKLVESAVFKLLPLGADDGLKVFLVIVAHVGLAAVFWYFFERPFVNRNARAGCDSGGEGPLRRSIVQAEA